MWLQKVSVRGHAGAEAALGGLLLEGDERAGIAKDTARGIALLHKAVEMGDGQAILLLAHCYLSGEGVEEDAAHGVTLLRQIINQEGASAITRADAETQLAVCYATGPGVEADTLQAAMWCQRGANGGCELANRILPGIRKCYCCGSTPALQLCRRCRKVRYCGAACQAAHWNRETDPHKGHCRRTAEA